MHTVVLMPPAAKAGRASLPFLLRPREMSESMPFQVPLPFPLPLPPRGMSESAPFHVPLSFLLPLPPPFPLPLPLPLLSPPTNWVPLTGAVAEAGEAAWRCSAKGLRGLPGLGDPAPRTSSGLGGLAPLKPSRLGEPVPRTHSGLGGLAPLEPPGLGEPVPRDNSGDAAALGGGGGGPGPGDRAWPLVPFSAQLRPLCQFRRLKPVLKPIKDVKVERNRKRL
jgi:hypothetical protein